MHPPLPAHREEPPAVEPVKPSWLGDFAAMRVLVEQAHLAREDDDLLRSARLLERAAHYGRGLPSDSFFDVALASARDYVAAGHNGRAMHVLRWLVGTGYRSPKVLQQSEEFRPLRTDAGFDRLVHAATRSFEGYKKAHADPETAPLVFADVPRFWAAYDLAMSKSTDAQKAAVFRRVYFSEATPGLVDYIWLKTKSAEQLVATLQRAAPYYEGIRERTLSAAKLEPQIRDGFRRFRDIYPDAHFPPTTFVIGRLNSGGTAGAEGMLIGLDIWSYQDGIPLDGVPESLQPLMKRMRLETLPMVVLHEQIHAMQQYGGEDTLLRSVMMEGSADFLAHLALPEQPQMPYYDWGLAHESRVWAAFEPQMRTGEYSDWMANYSGELLEPDWHPDLGYFVGARICEAYYAQSADKRKAVEDLLFMTDPFAILEASGYSP